LLKLIAWNDKKFERSSTKHVTDILLILQRYFEMRVDEIANNEDYQYLFDADNFNMVICGAEVIGHRLAKLCLNSVALKNQLIDILNEILEDTDNSLFITQMVANRDFSSEPEFCINTIKALQKGFLKN